MKFSPSPYPSAYGALLRWPLAPPTPSERPTAHQTVPDSFVCSLREPDTGTLGVYGIIFWPHRIRRGPPQRHFGVARFRSGRVRRRRFALHHLWKKIPRRRAHLRGAKARTAKIYAVVIFSEEKDGIPILLKYFGSLTTRWRIDPPADFVRQKHPPR